MDTQHDISALDADFSSLVGLIAVPPSSHNAPAADTPSSNDAEVSEFQRSQERVLLYLREHLVQGPADEIRDRIQTLLFDDDYHRLIQRIEQTVPVMAVREMLEDGELGTAPKNLSPQLHPRYELALRLQFEVVRVIVSAMPAAAERPRKRRSRLRRVVRPEARERLAFVFDATIPSTIKRVILSGWIAPMCSLGLAAAVDADVSEDVRATLLDQWIESLQTQLAFALATHAIQDLSDDLLPAEKRYDLANMIGSHYEGLGRTIQSLGDLNKAASK